MNRKPNLLLFMADQLQREPTDPSSLCKTPNMDKIGKRGVRFQRAYTSNPICSPARASLMTGLLPHNHGVLWVTHTMEKDQACLRRERKHWAEGLKEKGYNTGYFGKWHITHKDDPTEFGWETNGCNSTERYRNMVKHDSDYLMESRILSNEGYNDALFSGITSLKPEERSMGVATTLALEFLDEQKKETPWCCMVSVPEPHDPFICGEEAYEKYRDMEIPEKENWSDDLSDKPAIYRRSASVSKELSSEDWKEATRRYYASISEVDSQLGRILHFLEKTGQMDNTMIVILTDHGEFLGSHGLYCKNIGSFEEAFNIPLLICGPGISQNIKTDARVGIQDLHPTLRDYFSLNLESAQDSNSFLPVLEDPEKNENDYREGLSENFGGRFLITQRVFYRDRWKYVMNGFDYDELYNLEDDPGEMRNLAHLEGYENKMEEMAAGAWDWIRKTDDRTLLRTHYPPFRFIKKGPNV